MGVAMGSHVGCMRVGMGLYTVRVRCYGNVMGLYVGGMPAVWGCVGLYGVVLGCMGLYGAVLGLKWACHLGCYGPLCWWERSSMLVGRSAMAAALGLL